MTDSELQLRLDSMPKPLLVTAPPSYSFGFEATRDFLAGQPGFTTGSQNLPIRWADIPLGTKVTISYAEGKKSITIDKL